MRRSLNRRLAVIALGSTVLLSSSCVWIFQSVRVESLDPRAAPVAVTTPVKAHLLDGSTVIYETGATFDRDSVRGTGRRYALTGARLADVTAMTLDSVAAMESFRTDIEEAASTITTLTATGIAALGFAAAAVAIFGSCPTIYSDSGGTYALEAEAFSYSIAPLFERRDVDRLRARPDPDGHLRLEIRNEALETHYLNQLELLEVRHGADEIIAPDGANEVVALRSFVLPSRATDRAGRDLARVLASDDSLIFRTDPLRLRAASVDDLGDYIDIVIPTPAGDSAAVLFTARNSLLNTVLFYDIMLSAPGPRALDWIGSDLAHIGPAVALGRWYGDRMGMKVSVRRNGIYEPVTGVPNAGPIAWRAVTAVVPVPREDSLRIRLSFVADQWRINSVAVATGVRRVNPRVVPIAEIIGPDNRPDSAARAAMREVDLRHLRTLPGDRMTARFHVGTAPGDSSRTFLVASHGYYIEWMRGEWLRDRRRTAAFVPSDSSLAVAIDRWRSVQGDFERRFEATRIPVQ